MCAYIKQWPGNSPDLSPIEHCWAIMKINIPIEERHNKEVFKAAILREWANLD